MSLLNTALVGTIAGVAGGQALDRVAQFMYDRTDPKNIRLETEIEPRDPFIVLTQKVAARFDIKLTDENEKTSETIIKTVLCAGTGAAYVATSRRWSLGWLAGGAVFGTLFWLVEDEGIGPALGLAGDNTKYPFEAHVRGLVAHVAFGITAALVTEVIGSTQRRVN